MTKTSIKRRMARAFARGVSSITIKPQQKLSRPQLPPRPTDAENIRKDWKAIGNDLSRAITITRIKASGGNKSGTSG